MGMVLGGLREMHLLAVAFRKRLHKLAAVCVNLKTPSLKPQTPTPYPLKKSTLKGALT